MENKCYRTVEALEFGSIPIIGDEVVAPSCQVAGKVPGLENTTSPYRLFKLYSAPVFWVKNWNEDLPRVITEWEALEDGEKVRRRTAVFEWYVEFKKKLKLQFTREVERFFE